MPPCKVTALFWDMQYGGKRIVTINSIYIFDKTKMERISLFVPGRLCLFGEHSDWAGKYRSMNSQLVAGEAIVTGTEQGIYATVEKSENFEMTCSAESLRDVWHDFECPMNAEALKDVAHSGSFFSYCAGVASYMLEWYKMGG